MQPAAATRTQHASKIADELSHFLADTYVVYLKTQNFHWNVTGPNFAALHKLFEEQYQQLADAVDVIAERIRALGETAPASLSEFQKLTSIKEETGTPSAENMLRKLAKDHEVLVEHANIVFTKAEKAADQATMDLLIERIREHEKTIWMLKSSL